MSIHKKARGTSYVSIFRAWNKHLSWSRFFRCFKGLQTYIYGFEAGLRRKTERSARVERNAGFRFLKKHLKAHAEVNTRWEHTNLWFCMKNKTLYRVSSTMLSFKMKINKRHQCKHEEVGLRWNFFPVTGVAPSDVVVVWMKHAGYLIFGIMYAFKMSKIKRFILISEKWTWKVKFIAFL